MGAAPPGWDTARVRNSTRRGALALAGVALLFGAWGIAAEWFRYALADGQRWAPDLIVGLSWLGFAWVVTTRTAASRSGLLMLAYSGTWFIGNFAALEQGLLAGLAAQATYLHRGVLVHLLLTFPQRSFRRAASSRPWWRCRTGSRWCRPLARSTPITIALACLVTGAAGWRVRDSFGRARAPRVAALAAAGLVTTSLVVLARVRLTGAADDSVLLLAYQVVLLAVGAILTVAAVRLGRRGDEVAGLVIDLMDGPPAAMAAGARPRPRRPQHQGWLLDAGTRVVSRCRRVGVLDGAAPGRAVSIVQSRRRPADGAGPRQAATTLPADVSGPLVAGSVIDGGQCSVAHRAARPGPRARSSASPAGGHRGARTPPPRGAASLRRRAPARDAAPDPSRGRTGGNAVRGHGAGRRHGAGSTGVWPT